jgi:Na+-driven multidrug efflux pump
MRQRFGLMGRIDKALGCTTISTRGILAIIIPLMLQMLLEAIIGMFDTAITSSYGSEIIVANGIIGTVNTLLMNVIHAIGVGGAVLSAQYKGHGGAESVAATKRVIAQTTSLTVSVALFSTFFAVFLAKPFVRFLPISSR